ncbi:MAG: AAA family ATPase [Chloroflexi bacterium]|nr:AAA family ATPase [Chloroflexota bacterium]
MVTRKTIAIYGKGGIGKSTTASNISADLAKQGFKVMQFGCDPKSDSTCALLDGRYIPTILDTAVEAKTVREYKDIDVSKVMFQGYQGVYCLECGGPEPGRGCAGRGVLTAIELIKQQGVIDTLQPDFIIYDVLGDVVCGGFAMPIREGVAKTVYVVISPNYAAIYAANNIFKAILRFAERGGASLGGLIANYVETPAEKDIVDHFASLTKTRIVGYIPFSEMMIESDIQGKTVIEMFPESELAGIFRSLTSRIAEDEERIVPQPIEASVLRQWAQELAKIPRAAPRRG